MPKRQSFSDQLRQALLNAPMSRYRLAAECGIPESSLSRFVNGKMGLPLASIDKLADLLDWNLAEPRASKPKASPKAKPKQRSRKRGNDSHG